MSWKRFVRHMGTPRWRLKQWFGTSTLEAIEATIRESERTHRGELRFAIETALDVMPLLRGMTSRQRAIEVFGRLDVWDTEENSGVLIYLLLADHSVEIVADRGYVGKVDNEQWAEICREMEREFTDDRFEEGSLAGICAVGSIVAQHFPVGEVNPDELPDRPVIL
jgi:hypothetical protein